MNNAAISLVLISLFFPQFAKAQHTDLMGEFSNNIITFAINAYNMEETLEFYTTILGMQVVEEFSVDEEFAKSSGLSNGVPFHVKVLRLNDDPNSSLIKITSFETQFERTKAEFIQDNIGVQYLTIFVKDIAPFVERINSHNIKFRGKTPIPLGEERQFVLIQDPNGLFIELIGN